MRALAARGSRDSASALAAAILLSWGPPTSSAISEGYQCLLGEESNFSTVGAGRASTGTSVQEDIERSPAPSSSSRSKGPYFSPPSGRRWRLMSTSNGPGVARGETATISSPERTASKEEDASGFPELVPCTDMPQQWRGVPSGTGHRTRSPPPLMATRGRRPNERGPRTRSTPALRSPVTRRVI